MATLFISDLHLQESEPHLTRLFLHFMDTIAPQAETLYVLGDLFEVWLGDDDDGLFQREIIAAFRRYADSGKALFFLHGNRDFLLGQDFAARCGGELLMGPVVRAVHGHPTLILHGDELCTDDLSYQAFRAQVRDPAWQQAFLAKPLSERQQLAAGMRQASKEQAKEKSGYIMDANEAAVTALLAEHGVDRMIHGHTHRPAFHRVGANGERIVLGDWHERGCYLQLTGEAAALTYFEV